MNTATLPRDITIQMTATDQRVMDLLSDMIIRSGKKNPSKKEYACPGERWIGLRLDRCRQTISEAVQKLKRLGIIRVAQRRPVNGEWSTNLYRLGYWILRQLGRAKEAAYSISLPCRLKATHSSKTINNSNQTAARKEFSYKLKVPDFDIYLKELTKKFGFEE